MNRREASRRLIFASAGLATACKRNSELYFGRTIAPLSPCLRYSLGAEPESIDPAFFSGGYEGYVMHALFEGLTSYHPQTLKPMAAMATHYESSLDPARLTFYLRGHPRPRGQAFPNTNTLRQEFETGTLAYDLARGRRAPPDSAPAMWSDGTLVTAHDFVYAWKRVTDPKTAAPLAFWLSAVVNGDAVQSGKLPPERLAVNALDDFTFQIDLCIPPQSFLPLLSLPTLAAVPKRVVEMAKRSGAESSWTDPEHIVTNGAFSLSWRKPYDRTVVRRNPRYYEAGLVALEEIEFLPIADGVMTANLYRAGVVHAMPGERLSPLLNIALEGHPDYHVDPAFFDIWYSFNVRKPPFDNVLLRYAFNMAIDKAAIARCFGSGRRPARSLTPHMEGYEPPQSLRVDVDGRTCDVLAYDPPGARELLAKAGYRGGSGPNGQPLEFTALFPTLPHSRPIADMLYRQWRENLGVSPRLKLEEFNVWVHDILNLEYSGVAEAGGWPDYPDAGALIEWFTKGNPNSTSGYSDPVLDSMFAEARATLDTTERMRRLAGCETHILKSMPVIPVVHNVWRYLQKPFVRGMVGNVLDKHPFKYAWIDTNWRAV